VYEVILVVKVLKLNIDSVSRNLNKLMRLRYNILNSICLTEGI